MENILKENLKPAKRWLSLNESNEGDWVYHDTGELTQVCKDKYIDGFCLNSGYVITYASDNTKVYPITLHTKVIAEGINRYCDRMHKSGLIHGSKWVNWLNDKMDELMAIPDEADRSDYQKIWDSIENQIKELEYHKSFL